MSNQKPIGDDIANIIPQLTDEDWARIEARQAPVIPLRIPVRNRRADLEGLGWNTRALDAAERADESKPAIVHLAGWDDDRNVVVLSGDAGCGKSVAAAWWALKRHDRVRFIRAATFAASSRYDNNARDELYGNEALVLDDLGAEYLDTKGSFLVDLDELVDTYYSDRRPLVITTNLDFKAFKDRYNARIVDRLRECGRWLSVGGKSLRRAP